MGGRGSGGVRNSKVEFSEEKYIHINPNYGKIDKEKYESYNDNCVKCAFAFEANMRGEDVEARPYRLGHIEDVNKIKANNIERAFGENHRWEVGARKRELVIKRISNLMEDFGPNSRAFLFLYHKHGKHLVNVLANNGNPIIVDAQSGEHGSPKNMLKYYITKEAYLMRVDNSTIPEEWKKWAYKRREK